MSEVLKVATELAVSKQLEQDLLELVANIVDTIHNREKGDLSYTVEQHERKLATYVHYNLQLAYKLGKESNHEQ